MGYTHYWTYDVTDPRFASAWPHILADSLRICDSVAACGVVLTDAGGEGAPTLDLYEGIALNGSAARGEDYESFALLPPARIASCRARWFCKTGARPYDLAVTSILLRCRMLLPDRAFLLSSDGSWAQWATGIARGLPGPRQLIAELFGPVPDLAWDRLW